MFSLRTRQQPYMVRHAYVHEMRSALTYPLAASLAEGSFTGVVAAKYFQASPLLIAVITAAPMFGNIAALVWSELSRTRRMVPFVNVLQGGVVLSIAAASLTRLLPQSPGGGVAGWAFALDIILVRVLASGIVTVRSAIWRANYPRHIRGQIVGRISMVATAVLAMTTFLGSSWLDHNPEAFAYLYPIAAALGAIGIWQFSKIRVRQERSALRRQQLYTPRPENLAQTDESNVLNYQPNGEPRGVVQFFAEAWRILRQDKQFRDYQRWQFLSGFSFMMLAPPLVFMVSKEMTKPATEYLLATIVLQILPMAVSLPFTQIWSPLFDRVHITRFRVGQGMVSVLAQGVLFLGAIYGQLWIVAIAQMLIGISNAGGNLAWNLGHNDFAPPEKTATYMGVHVMLTGLRGCVAPFAGVLLYQSGLAGHGVFAISTILSMISLFGFWHMSRTVPRTMPIERVRQMAQAVGDAPPKRQK